MLVSVPTATTPVTLTKVAVRCRYDVPGYTTGGLCWADLANKEGARTDAYLVWKAGKAIGYVEKADKGWTGMKASTAATAALPDPDGVAFVCCLQGEFKTRVEALASLVYWASKNNY